MNTIFRTIFRAFFIGAVFSFVSSLSALDEMDGWQIEQGDEAFIGIDLKGKVREALVLPPTSPVNIVSRKLNLGDEANFAMHILSEEVIITGCEFPSSKIRKKGYGIYM